MYNYYNYSCVFKDILKYFFQLEISPFLEMFYYVKV